MTTIDPILQPLVDAAMKNLAIQFALSEGRTVAECRYRYDDLCIDFAGDCCAAIPGSRLAYFKTPNHPKWRFHAAVELHGIIHDLWQDSAMPLETYLGVIGAEKVEFPAEETV